jgi:hypothetical protein
MNCEEFLEKYNVEPYNSKAIFIYQYNIDNLHAFSIK